MTSTWTSGNAGTVNVSVNGVMTVNGQGNSGFTGVESGVLQGSGQGGNVTIQARTLDILNGGQISSNTYDQGGAGKVTVKANLLNINGYGTSSDTGILSASIGAQSSGQTGDVTVTANDSLSLTAGGQISSTNEAVVPQAAATSLQPGNITITAPSLLMQDSFITTQSTGNLAAGGININIAHALTMNLSSITTSANTGNGGPITINGGNGYLDLVNSGITTSVAGANGNGGNIQLTAGVLVMDTAEIQANAFSGAGGNIALNLSDLLSSGDTLIEGGAPVAWNPAMTGLNLIQAASQAGVSGALNVTAPQLNLSGVLANPGGPQFDTGLISQDFCDLGEGSSLTRLGHGGLPIKASEMRF